MLFEPRSATSCRRVFQADYATGLAGADEVLIAPVYRTTIPADRRLDPARLAADLTASGTRARHVDSIDAMGVLVENETRAGDVVVLMSNGNFGGLRMRLRDRLGIDDGGQGETSA